MREKGEREKKEIKKQELKIGISISNYFKYKGVKTSRKHIILQFYLFKCYFN